MSAAAVRWAQYHIYKSTYVLNTPQTLRLAGTGGFPELPSSNHNPPSGISPAAQAPGEGNSKGGPCVGRVETNRYRTEVPEAGRGEGRKKNGRLG